ncbi:MAG: hypothetical protein ACR2NA_10795 [Solirubrobacterales bacterium]
MQGEEGTGDPSAEPPREPEVRPERELTDHGPAGAGYQQQPAASGAGAAAASLKPLGVGEVLDAAVTVFRRNWQPLVTTVAVVAVPIYFLVFLVSLGMPDGAQTGFTINQDGTTSFNEDEIATVVGLTVVIQLLTLAAYLLAVAGCFRAVADAYLGQEADWQVSLRFAVRRALPLLWLFIVLYVAVVVGFLLLIIPGIWLAVSFSVAIPAMLIGERRGTQALKRSFRLVRGRWWPTAGTLIVAYLLTIVVSFIVAIPLGIVGLSGADSQAVAGLANLVANVASAMITLPFFAAVITVLYVDLRVRKEGFDLQLLADQLRQESEPDNAAGAARA